MNGAGTGLRIVALLILWAVAPVGAQVGERPRNTDETRAAERALDDAEDAQDASERLMHFQTALASAEAAIAADETNPLGHRLAALAALGLEQYEEADASFDRAAELYPLYELQDQPLREQTWIDLYQQATPLVQAGDYEAAAVIFEGAHAIYDGRPEVMVTLGQIYAQLGEHDRSIELIDEALAFLASETVASMDSATVAEWSDQAAELPSLRAQVFAVAGRFEEAAQAYQELATGDPSNMEYKRGLASVLMEAGNEAEALEVYLDLLDTPGLSGSDLYALGVGFYRASDYQNAVKAFSGAADRNVRDRDALEMWARSLTLDTVYADIPSVAERWVELDPYGHNGFLIWGQAANQIGDTESTQRVMATVQELEVNVDQLQLERFGGGGGIVHGSVINKTLGEGTSVALVFTFYGPTDEPIGSATAVVVTGAADMAEVFSVQFDTAEEIGGYSYELTIG